MPLYFDVNNLIRISHKPPVLYKHIAGLVGWFSVLIIIM